MNRKALTLAALASAAVPGFAQVNWIESWPQALALSKKEGKPILGEFMFAHCCKCIYYDTKLFKSPEFAAWSSKKVILFRCDLMETDPKIHRQNEGLIKTYEVKGSPKIIVLNSKGQTLGRPVFLTEVKEWIRSANAIVEGKPATSHGLPATRSRATMKR